DVKENYKAQLQEWTQSRAEGIPIYAVVSMEGPAHDPLFSVSVSVGEKVAGSGSGHSKKDAEQAAAKDALINLGVSSKQTETRKGLAPSARTGRRSRPLQKSRAAPCAALSVNYVLPGLSQLRSVRIGLLRSRRFCIQIALLDASGIRLWRLDFGCGSRRGSK